MRLGYVPICTPIYYGNDVGPIDGWALFICGVLAFAILGVLACMCWQLVAEGWDWIEKLVATVFAVIFSAGSLGGLALAIYMTFHWNGRF